MPVATVIVVRSSTSPATVDLVVTDLDGTLWDHGERMHDETLAALHELRARDVPLLVATGRRLASAATTLAAHDLELPMVVLDGAIGRDLRSGVRFQDAPFDADDARRVLDAFAQVDVSPVAYVDRLLVGEATGARRFTGTEVVAGQDCSTHPRHVEIVGDLLAHADLGAVVQAEPVYGFGVFGVARTALEEVLRRVGPHGLGVLTAVFPPLGADLGALMVRPAHVSKWRGVEAWCGLQGLDPSRVLAVGDGDNDLELLEGAAVSCVIADGTPAALRLADHVLEPPAQAGWKAVLDLV